MCVSCPNENSCLCSLSERAAARDVVRIKLNKEVDVGALIDSGAITKDYINYEVVRRLNLPVFPLNNLVCSGLKDGSNRHCVKSKGHSDIEIEYWNEATQTTESIHIYPIIVDLDYDLVLGKETIHENDLMDKLRFQIFGPKKGDGVRRGTEPICSSAKEAVESDTNHVVRPTADPWPLNTIVDK
jgi:hypothetical protein